MAEDVQPVVTADKPSDDAKSTQNQYWPGFTVRCDNCGGFNVHLDNSMGYSDLSGSWGSIDFVCEDCKISTEIVSS